jgi:hypothetical protein
MSSLNFKELSKETFSNDNPISEWEHGEYLLKFYNMLVSELGEPSYVVNKKNGIVVWDQSSPNKKWGNWIVEHYLKDEKVQHTDFFYTTVKIFVPVDKVPLVQSISGSVILDLLKNTVTARCGSTKANYGTLRTVVDVIQGNFNYPKKEISELYKRNLTNMTEEKNYNIDRVRNYIRKNPVKELKYHPFAFPEACDNVETFSDNVETFSDTPKMKEVKFRPNENTSKMKEVFYKK